MLQASDSHLKHACQNLALIALSLAFLPLNTFILISAWLVHYQSRQKIDSKRAAIRRDTSFRPRRILVSGVGMTKGLAIARNFYEAGHNVIGADFEADGSLVCGRVSRSLREFIPLRKPSPPPSSNGLLDAYTQDLLHIVTSRKVDLWVSCSGVASAVSDGQAKELVESRTTCKAIQFDIQTTQTLHEKDSFIAHTRNIGLNVPETYPITSQAEVERALSKAPEGRRYIMKPVGMDDSSRGDMTFLPQPTAAETSRHLAKLRISPKLPWILQQYIQGREFCTHSLVVRGEVKLFVACPSAELLMHYEALPASSKLSQEMLKFTKRYAEAGGDSFTGHLSFDFFVEDAQLANQNSDPDAELTLYPIECNPRAHTAVALFNGTDRMANAYLSLLSDSNDTARPTSKSNNPNLPNGTELDTSEISIPFHPTTRYFWVGHDIATLLVLPLLSLLTFQPDSSFTLLIRKIDILVDHLIFWRDGTFESWDPLPWWWLYHVYWPWQFALAIWKGKKWSRINGGRPGKERVRVVRGNREFGGRWVSRTEEAYPLVQTWMCIEVAVRPIADASLEAEADTILKSA